MEELKPYKTVARPAQAEYVEKKSRFIATVSPVADDDEGRSRRDSCAPIEN